MMGVQTFEHFCTAAPCTAEHLACCCKYISAEAAGFAQTTPMHVSCYVNAMSHLKTVPVTSRHLFLVELFHFLKERKKEINSTDFGANYHQWALLLALTAPFSSHPECPKKTKPKTNKCDNMSLNLREEANQARATWQLSFPLKVTWHVGGNGFHLMFLRDAKQRAHVVVFFTK